MGNKYISEDKRKFLLILLTTLYFLFETILLNQFIANFLFLLCIILTGYLMLQTSLKKEVFKSKKLIIVLVFLLFRFLSLIYYRFDMSVIHQLVYEMLFLGTILFIKVNKLILSNIYKTFLLLVLIVNIASIIVLFFQIESILKDNYIYIYTSEQFIWKGLFSNPNICGLINALTLIILFQYPKLFNSVRLKVVLFITSGAIVFLSGSRNAILLLVLIIIYIKFFSRFNISYSKTVWVIILLPAILISFLNFASFDLETETKLNTISATRYDLWQYSIKSMDLSTLIVGEINPGEKRFSLIPEEKKEAMGDYYKHTLSRNNPHNGYIKLLIEDGIFAFYSFILLLLYIISNTKSSSRTIVIFVLGINLFESLLMSNRSVFVFILCVSLCNLLTTKEDIKDENNIYNIC